MPVVVGVGRSGTTLLRMMLDSHPELAVPPETHFLPRLARWASWPGRSPEAIVDALRKERRWADFDLDPQQLADRLRGLETLDPTTVARTFYGLYAERHAKPRYGDKTPPYINHMRLVQRVLPEARFIHLIRDGRDVAASRARRGMPRSRSASDSARLWRARIVSARRQAQRLDHYLELRYEDLVAEPEPRLREVCELIELEFDPAMLDYHRRAEQRLTEMARELPAHDGKPARPASERVAAHALTREPPTDARVAAWRQEMPDSDVRAFERIAGSLLRDLGYETEGAAPAAGARS